jgi:hypothetical protein
VLTVPKARDVLLELFPNWTTLAVNAEPCGVCEVAASATSEDRRNMRLQAEIEKVYFCTFCQLLR